MRSGFAVPDSALEKFPLQTPPDSQDLTCADSPDCVCPYYHVRVRVSGSLTLTSTEMHVRMETQYKKMDSHPAQTSYDVVGSSSCALTTVLIL